jgi:hypothetical protein
MRALKAYLELRKRATAGDPTAKAEIAKIAANPTAIAVLKHAAQSLHRTASAVQAITQVQGAAAAAAADVDDEQLDDESEIYSGDELDDADRAHRQLPPGSGDLEHKALLRKMKQVAAGQVAPLSNTNPSAVFNAGVLGNQATVSPGDLQQVVNFQSDDSETTTLALVIAPVQQQVTTDLDFVSDPLLLGPVLGNRPYARVQFGNRGFSQFAYIDIGTGAQLTVSGSMVTVEVGLKVNPNIATAAMQLAGMISSFKPIMRTSPLTFTLYADDGGVVSTNIYPVPPFAKRVTFIKQNIADVVTLKFLNFFETPPGNFEYPWSTIATNAQQADPILLPNDVFAVSATNANGNAQGRFVFELGI